MDIVILAAGLGSRFFAGTSKVMVDFWGIPVLEMLCLNALKVSSSVYVVVKDLSIVVPDGVVKILQEDAYGTGIAAQSYLKFVGENRNVLIIPGDSPLVDFNTLKHFSNLGDDVEIGLGIMKTPEGSEHYGRVFQENGLVQKIIEYKHHHEKTEYSNTGIIFLSKRVVDLLFNLPISESGEVYLTEIVQIAVNNGYKVKSLVLPYEDCLGFNTIAEFHSVLSFAQVKWRKKALKSGAIFYDINTVYLSYDTVFEAGAVVEPYTKFAPGVCVCSKAVVKSFSSLSNCRVNGVVGPFAHIRSGEVQEKAEVGAFVEMNRSILGVGSKAKHLSYLGDAYIEDSVNIGAGCVVCNYDGKNKHKTNIGQGSFVGANTTIIAPINIGKDALLAAGSTLNKDIPDGVLAIARSHQTNKERFSKKD